MVEKFEDEDAKNGNFNNQMDFCKKSNNELRVILAIDEEVALLIITAFYVENKRKNEKNESGNKI